MKFFVVMLQAVVALGCADSVTSSTGTIDEHLTPIPFADKVDVRRRGDPYLVIRDSETITELTDFVNSYPSGWTVPFAGPPVGEVYFDFYHEGRFVGNFYVGPRFFGRDQGNFYSIEVAEDKIRRLEDIVGFVVDE